MTDAIKVSDVQVFDPHTGNSFLMSGISNYAVSIQKQETENEYEKHNRLLTNNFECTFDCTHVFGHAFRRITGTCSNNELRMHHEPMMRKRMSYKKARWKILKVIRTGRGNPNKKIMVIHNKYWK